MQHCLCFLTIVLFVQQNFKMLNQSGMYSASCSRQNSELGVCSVYKAVKLAMNAVYEIGERDKAVNEDPYTNW